jgi:DNA-binding sugar fermentation-stimulating protein
LDGLVNDLQHFSQINSEITLGDHCKIDFEILWYRSDTSFTPPTTNIENDLPKRKKIKNQIENSNKIIERRILLEVKSVTLAIEDSTSDELRAQFPDCVSERAQKHCERLTDYVKRGGEAMILFLVQRDDCTSFSASQYDTKYGKLLNKALLAGVKILVYQCRLDPETSTITWLGDIPFVDVYQDIEKM